VSEVKTDLLTQENKYESMNESIKVINLGMNGFKKIIKSNESIDGEFKKQCVDMQATLQNLQNIIPSSDNVNQLSYANIVKNGGSIQKITDKVITEA